MNQILNSGFKKNFVPLPAQEKFLSGDWILTDESPETWECYLHGRIEDIFRLHGIGTDRKVVFCAKCFIKSMIDLGLKDLTKTSSRGEKVE